MTDDFERQAKSKKPRPAWKRRMDRLRLLEDITILLSVLALIITLIYFIGFATWIIPGGNPFTPWTMVCITLLAASLVITIYSIKSQHHSWMISGYCVLVIAVIASFVHAHSRWGVTLTSGAAKWFGIGSLVILITFSILLIISILRKSRK